ncbi:MAG: hypothetical protein MAG715_00439 [Methanonatronarchaeales archaeon]|nr:hypothetical protein [Methanonatronarchaeales archaeon]
MSEPEPDETLDIRGVVCPYTFVKTKLGLESMDSGEVLCVEVDYEPATRNVPRSLKEQGHEVLCVEAINEGEWRITTRKG